MIFAFKFSIDDHKLHVIATDGHDVIEYCVDSIIINSGERYDFYIVADKPVDNYWVRAKTLTVNTGPNTKVRRKSVHSVVDYPPHPQTN